MSTQAETKQPHLNFDVEEFDVVTHCKHPHVYGVVLDRGFSREDPDLDETEPLEQSSGGDSEIPSAREHGDFPDPNESDEDCEEDYGPEVDDNEDDEAFPLEFDELEVDFGDEESTSLKLADTVVIDRPTEEGSYCVAQFDPITKTTSLAILSGLSHSTTSFSLYCEKDTRQCPRFGIPAPHSSSGSPRPLPGGHLPTRLARAIRH
jgi:hypothetical protein